MSLNTGTKPDESMNGCWEMVTRCNGCKGRITEKNAKWEYVCVDG